MKDVNKVILVGRLGKDPVQRATKKGVAVVNFSLATSRRVVEHESEDGEKKMGEETQWHNIVAWGKQGEACAQRLRKGAPVYVEGSFRSREYTGNDGQKRFTHEVHVENVSFLENKGRVPSHEGGMPVEAAS